MVTVAVAGGLGGVGRTIADAVNESKKHKAITLTRKVSSEYLFFLNMFPPIDTFALQAPEVEDPNNPIIVVDYADIKALTAILEKNNVGVVISTIKFVSAEAGQAESNLAKAASASLYNRPLRNERLGHGLECSVAGRVR